METTKPESMTPDSLDLLKIWSREPPKLDYVLPGLPRGTVGALLSAGGVGKTFTMLQTALGVALGRDVGQIWGGALPPGRAMYLSLEDPPEVLAIRLHALKLLLTSSAEEAAAARSLTVIPGAGSGLSIKAVGSEVALPPWFRAFRERVQKDEVRLLVVDTFNRLLGGISENDGGLMGWVVTELEVLAKRAGCAVILCHHISKAAALTGRSADEAHAARGSSVITDNTRWVVNLAPVKEKRSEITLSFTKLNYGSPREPRQLVREGNGTLRDKAGASKAAAMAAVPSA